MVNDEIIKINDINYVVYKLGDWKNQYEINQVGLSHEIPVTKNTVKHVKDSMKEIRASQFDISDKTVNGFVAITLQLNSKMQKMKLDEVISLEEEEYNKILAEIDTLELLDDDSELELKTEDYLIYKLEKECHVTNSIPANDFARKVYLEEMKRIEEKFS